MWNIIFINQLKDATKYLSEHRTISEKKCIEMFQENGTYIYQTLKDKGIGKSYGYGDLIRTPETDHLLSSGYFDNLIKEMNQQEEDDKLERDYKRSVISHNRKTYRISVIALIISIISMTPIRECLLRLIEKIISMLF